MNPADTNPRKSTEITNTEKNQGLPWIVVGVIGFGFYVTFTASSVFILFLDHVGMSKLQIGFLLSLSPFFGLLALFIAPAASRIGYKRTTILALIVRNIVPVLLVLTPWILGWGGFSGLYIFVIFLLIFQAATNTIAQTAWFPWEQEYVPPAIRGKFFAATSAISNLMTFIALGIAGAILGKDPGTNKYLLLFILGAGFGMFGTWAFSRVGGGAPEFKPGLGKAYFRSLVVVFKDKNFILFLGGIGLIFFTTSQFGAFIPLYMQDQIGLDSGRVVLLATGATIGSMASAYLWGWLIDRYGGKPMMIGSLVLFSLIPVFWFIMPRHSSLSFAAAFAIALLNGSISIGWGLASVRQLYASVPVAQKSEYMAIYYACFGVMTGFSQLAGGWLLDIFKHVKGSLWGFSLDPFSILFGLGVLIPPFALLLLRHMQSDSRINALQMAGMFVRGNPLMAFESILRYQIPGAELAAISTTERLGLAESPLTVHELVSSTSDPRFNVRLEAVLSIARRQPDPLLTETLTRILQGSDPALASIAAWALSRSGDQAAIPALRNALEAPYRSVQAHSARSLGTLNDQDASLLLLEKLAADPDPGLQTACAAALGKLGCREAVPSLLELLVNLPESSQRMEVALALSRILGNETAFIRLHRQVRKEQAGTLAEAVSALEYSIPARDEYLLLKLADCSSCFARGEIKAGAVLLGDILHSYPTDKIPAKKLLAMQMCATELIARETTSLEVLLLSINLLVKAS